MLKTIVHRPGKGLEGRSAQRLAEAYARMIARRPDGVELDVRVTADGVPIVAHDPRARIGRTSRPIAALAYTALPLGTFLPLADLMPVFAGFRGRVYVEIKDVRRGGGRARARRPWPLQGRVWFVGLPWKRGRSAMFWTAGAMPASTRSSSIRRIRTSARRGMPASAR